MKKQLIYLFYTIDIKFQNVVTEMIVENNETY